MVIHKDMFDDSEERPTVLVSGGFDPVHVGHIRMIREASKYGDVIVIANSDEWLHSKKGFMFMDFRLQEVPGNKVSYGPTLPRAGFQDSSPKLLGPV